jgi:hypothetical protein
MADGTTDTPTTDTPAARRDAFDDVDYADVVGVAAPLRGEARVAASTQEAWAHGALIALTGACDGAKEDDGVGFNKSDTNAGRYLGHFVARGGMLDDVEWQGAVDMLKKYHGQAGRVPRADALDTARSARVAEQAEAFRARLTVVLTEARRVQKARAKHLKRLSEPDVVITRENTDAPDGGVWTVLAPFNEPAVQAWRNLHREFGGGWSKSRGVRIVPYKGARAIHALLTAHHAGQYAKGLKGAYVIGSTLPPVLIEVLAASAARPVAVAPTARPVLTVSDALEVLGDVTATEAEIAAAMALLA